MVIKAVGYWIVATVSGVCLGVGVMWLAYQWGWDAGWVRGHNDGVEFAEKADEHRVKPSPEAASSAATPVLMTVTQRDVRGDDGQIVCTIHVTKRTAANGRLIEASTEAMACPCTGR